MHAKGLVSDKILVRAVFRLQQASARRPFQRLAESGQDLAAPDSIGPVGAGKNQLVLDAAEAEAHPVGRRVHPQRVPRKFLNQTSQLPSI